jgi:hypothetical protein
MDFIKRYRIWIVLALLIVPVTLRGLSFYHGFVIRPKVLSPHFATNTLPEPPISTSAPEQIAIRTGKVVIMDFLHSNQIAPSDMSTFVSALTKRGTRVEISNGDLPLATQLKYASAYLVFSPSTPFSAEEVNLVRNFVTRGGRLMVFADPTRSLISYDYTSGSTINQPDADSANNLLAPFGISINNDYLYNLVKSEGNFRNVLFSTFGKNTLTSDLTQVAFYGVHSVDAGSGKPLIIGDKDTYSSLTDSGGSGMAAAAVSADGNVLVFGDFSFMIPPYNTVADNEILIRHIADYALSGTRTHNVADFPYVFDRDISVIPAGGMQINADMLAPLASLQNELLATSTSLVIQAKPPADGDLLVVGSLTPSDDLMSYIGSFHLGLDDTSTIVIPGIGTVSRTGIGLLLYHFTPTRNTLIILTDTPDDLPALIDLLSRGDLSSCVTQGDIGVCSIGSGGSYYTEPTWEPPLMGTSSPTPSKETPSPAPSG